MFNDEESLLKSGESVSLYDESYGQKKAQEENKKSESSGLGELTKASDKILFRTKTVFPFTFFPDTLIVDYQKISIIKKKFFMSQKIDSINHNDVLHVEVDTGPLFATLRITTKYFSEKPIRIQYLPKSPAIKVRDLLHGLISARQEDISFSEVDGKKLSKKLQRIGKVEVE